MSRKLGLVCYNNVRHSTVYGLTWSH